MKRILFFSRDPGAANCVIPVYKKLQGRKDLQTDLVGKDFALNKYSEAGLEGKDIVKLVSPLNLSSIKEFLENNKYNLVITGTGTDFTDRLLWKSANELSIQSIAIIDQWINYEVRFTFDELGKYKETSPKVFPTFICTIDEYAKKEMIAKGLPEEKIIVTGQPYFETVIERHNAIDAEKRIEIRKKLSLEKDDHIITFVSEPIVESYTDPFYSGYTEFSILEQIIKALSLVVCYNSRQYALVVRLHPRNKKELFHQFLKTIHIPQNIKLIIEDKLLSQELIAVSDMIIGMSSMFLIEAAIVGKQYVSVQIGLKIEDPFVLSRLNFSNTILSYDDLVLLFRDYVKDGIITNKSKFSVIPNASDRIIELIEKIS